MIEMPAPRPLADDEVLIQVMAAGVGNWDEIVRTGGWDVGRSPPIALGVEAAGKVVAVSRRVTDRAPGDEVITHPLPLRDQGTWAPNGDRFSCASCPEAAGCLLGGCGRVSGARPDRRAGSGRSSGCQDQQ